MAPDSRLTLEADDLDSGDGQMLRLLHACDRSPQVDAAFAARLLAELESEIAARDRVHLYTMLDVSTLAIFHAELEQRNGNRRSSVPGSPASHGMCLRAIGSQIATAALVLLVILVSVSTVGGIRLTRGPDRVPLLGQLWSAPTPAASDPVAMHGLLTQMTVPSLPADTGWIAIDRWTLSPHTDPIPTFFSGPTMIFVLSGQLSVTLDQPGQIADAMGRQHPKPFPAATPGKVGAGESLLALSEVTVTTGNDIDVPVTALFVSVVRDTPRDWETSFAASKRAAIESLVSDNTGEFASGPGRMMLSRETLAPGEMLPAPDADTYQLVAAESKYLGYLRRPPDGSVTNLEKTPLTVLILTITQNYPTLEGW